MLKKLQFVIASAAWLDNVLNTPFEENEIKLEGTDIYKDSIYGMLVEACATTRVVEEGKNNQKEFVIEYADEIITFEEKLISQNFDIIKINATTHVLGVRAEREWLNKKYPGYENNMQILTHIETKQGTRTFDILPIRKGNIKKDIYFDITDFFDGASVPYHKNVSEYAEAKINQIYQ